MKRAFIGGLVLIGAGFGYWMAQENWALFELSHPSGQSRRMDRIAGGGGHRVYDESALETGLEIWQVKELMGPPDSRSVITDEEGRKREEWRYGRKRIVFVNGMLMSWGEAVGKVDGTMGKETR